MACTSLGAPPLGSVVRFPRLNCLCCTANAFLAQNRPETQRERPWVCCFQKQFLSAAGFKVLSSISGSSDCRQPKSERRRQKRNLNVLLTSALGLCTSSVDDMSLYNKHFPSAQRTLPIETQAAQEEKKTDHNLMWRSFYTDVSPEQAVLYMLHLPPLGQEFSRIRYISIHVKPFSCNVRTRIRTSM